MERENNASAPALADRLSAILLMLRQILGAQARTLRLNPSLQWTVWNRLLFLARRFGALAANPPKPRPIRTRKPKPTPETPAPKSELSHHKGWLMLLLPGYQAAGARSQLIHLLDDPDLVSLLAENPSLGRVLRPLCHMLRISLPLHLQRERKPRKPRLHCAKPAQKPPQKPSLTLLEHLLQKYPPPVRPMLPGHRYTPTLNFSKS